MKYLFETAHLGVRAFATGDAESLYANHREDAVKKWIPNECYEDLEEAKAAYDRGETPWCVTYHFMPEELTEILTRFGVKNISLAGPGAFARTLPNEILVKIMNDAPQREAFLDFCHLYDSNPYVCGMGKDNLFAKGER